MGAFRSSGIKLDRSALPAITIRQLHCGERLDQLTALLRRAFYPLGRMGLNCTCVDQSAAVTRERVIKGACYVAECDGRLVGTVTLYGCDASSPSAWYHLRRVASIHQFAVDPEFQGKGLGCRLLEFAEDWARQHSYQELALDTPHPAKHLVAFYTRQGFRPVESVHFQDKRYCSVVLSKSVEQAPPALNGSSRPCRSLLLALGFGDPRASGLGESLSAP
jgi:GNAT superfamily N-acetyltransferase